VKENEPKENACVATPLGSPVRRGCGRTRRNSPASRQVQTVAASLPSAATMLGLV